ncbi:hypothetical protein AAKU55_005582 [Oxalobacteraceae bacterium GrIS 1.11]
MARPNPDPNPPPRPREWHLDKTVSATHLFSTMAAIATLVVLGSKFDTRVTLIEQANAAQHAVDTRQDKEIDDFKHSVREDYRAIDDKLQRLIEKAKP